MKRLMKRAFESLGLKVEWRDRLIEQIPSNYLRSPYLPRVYRTSVGRLICFQHVMEKIDAIEGDIVECGVSIGYGMLEFMLLGELSGKKRKYWGFDSFEGFPEPVGEDMKRDGTYQAERGGLNTPIEIVYKVLSEGRVSKEAVRDDLTLVKGFFDKTLVSYSGRIALLHLDCDLYDSYKVCLEEMYEKVVRGGVILFDEYEDANFPGARRAVDEFFGDKPEEVIRYEQLQYEKYYVIKQ